ncbi:hypothetical protein FRB93_004470 [Tulasnella sp. JGI-2019a]|nr:hypothetical protein FRB93_004470 [Tulasnella sp. JGI-2019a]
MMLLIWSLQILILCSKWLYLSSTCSSVHATPAVITRHDGIWTLHLSAHNVSTQGSDGESDPCVIGGSLQFMNPSTLIPGLVMSATVDFRVESAKISFADSAGEIVGWFVSTGGFWEPCLRSVRVMKFGELIPSEEPDLGRIETFDIAEIDENRLAPAWHDVSSPVAMQPYATTDLNDTVGAIFRFGSVVAYTWASLITFDTTDGHKADMRCWGPGLGGGEVFGVLKYESGDWDALLSKPGNFYITGGGKGVGGIIISFLVDDVVRATFLGAGHVIGGLVGLNGTCTWSKIPFTLPRSLDQ